MCVDLALTLENVAHLVGRDSVNTAAEGYELDEVHVLLVGDVSCGGIKPCVVRPLVENARCEFVYMVADRILRNDGNAEACYHSVDAVVDLRVYVVRSA